MIVIPQADLLMINLTAPVVAPVVASPDSGPAPRFDVALLEAAKAVKDGTPEGPSLNLAPKVQQALESLLADLSQKPLDQLKSLAKQPDALNALVIKSAKDAGLNVEEQQALLDLVPMALPRLVDLKTNIEVQGTMPADSTRISGDMPGPQGGTPVKAASPADLLFANENRPQPSATASPIAKQDQKDPGNATLSTLAAAMLTPVIVSTRTDDGSGSQSSLAPKPQADAPVAPMAAPAPTGRVIQVAVQAPVPNALVAPAEQAPTAPELTSQAGAAPAVQAPNAPVVQGTPLVQGASAPQRDQAPVKPQAAVTNAAPSGQTPVGTVPAPVQAVAENAPAQAQAGEPVLSNGAETAARAEGKVLTAPADMEVQVLDPQAPVAIQPGSQVTLTADNRWITPTNAQPSPQGAVTAAPTPAPLVLDSVQAQAPTTVSKMPLSESAVPSARVEGPQFQATASQPQTSVPLAPVSSPASFSPAAVQTSVNTASTVSAAVVAQAAAVGQPEQTAPVKDANLAPEAKAPAAVNVSGDANSAGNAAAVQARRPTDDSSFNGLAQFGQDPMKTIVQQTAKDYAVKRAVFDQVTEALRNAPDTDSGKLLIRLKPANLGEVQVDLVMQGGKLTARLVASQADVREAFLRDLPAFKAGLEAQGVSVKEISVALRAGVQDQPQGQAQQQDQTWWRELTRGDQAASAVVPVLPAYSGTATVKDERFSALA